MFCKAPFTSLMGSLKHNISFKYSYIIFVQLNTLEIWQSIEMSDRYKSPSRLNLLDAGGKYHYNLPEENPSNNH